MTPLADGGRAGANEGAKAQARRAIGLRWRPVGESPQGAAQGAATALEALLDQVSCVVVGAGCWLPVPADWQLRGSVPANYVAMLCVGGAAEYRIGEETYRLRPGRLLLCPPRVPRTGHHDPADPLHLYSVHFQARLYGTLDVPSVYRLPVALTHSPHGHARMVRAAQRILAELDGNELGHVLAANGAGAELLALIWREAGGGSAPASRDGTAVGSAAELARLAPVFRLIEARYAGPLTLGQLADAAHLQPAYFSTLFGRVSARRPCATWRATAWTGCATCCSRATSRWARSRSAPASPRCRT